MPGKRQPTDVVLANGRKHLSRAEEAQRRAGEVKLPQAETARPPGWLPKELKKTFRALGKQLIQAKLYTELDADTLGRYVAAQHQWELATGHVEEALEAADQEEADGWSRIQDRYFKQARACANDMGLYHLLADGEAIPNVGIFAVDRENAETLYKAAKYMVEHTAMGQPPHKPMVYCRDSVREIRTRFGGVMKVYSNDVENKHGPSFSAILADELHAWKGRGGRARWEVLTQGSDAARLQQTVLVLTTAGDDPDRRSIGWEVHEKCRRVLAWRRGEPERPMDEDETEWLPIMYGISTLTGDDPDKIAALDIYDEALWKRCNPNYGVILQPRKFRAEAKAAKLNEGSERSFRWLRLNQWVATKDVGWIPLTIYDKTQIGPSAKGEREEWVREHLAGKRCYGGLDLSATTDLTAFVLLFPPQEGLDSWVMLPRAWRPLDGVVEAERRDHVPYRDWERAGFLHLCPGDLIDYSAVERAIYEAAEDFDLQCLGLDPALSRTLVSRLTAPYNDAGEPKPEIACIDIPQGMLHMSPPTKDLERLIRSRKMLHVHNTCARWCFGNARCYVDANENMKLMKNRSMGRIDITVAWVIALATATIMAAQETFDKTTLGEDWSL